MAGAGDFVGTKHCYQVVVEVLDCFCYSNRQDEHQGEVGLDHQAVVDLDPNWVADRVVSIPDCSGYDFGCSSFYFEEIARCRQLIATGSSPCCSCPLALWIALASYISKVWKTFPTRDHWLPLKIDTFFMDSPDLAQYRLQCVSFKVIGIF